MLVAGVVFGGSEGVSGGVLWVFCGCFVGVLWS